MYAKTFKMLHEAEIREQLVGFFYLTSFHSMILQLMVQTTLNRQYSCTLYKIIGTGCIRTSILGRFKQEKYHEYLCKAR